MLWKKCTILRFRLLFVSMLGATVNKDVYKENFWVIPLNWRLPVFCWSLWLVWAHTNSDIYTLRSFPMIGDALSDKDVHFSPWCCCCCCMSFWHWTTDANRTGLLHFQHSLSLTLTVRGIEDREWYLYRILKEPYVRSGHLSNKFILKRQISLD